MLSIPNELLVWAIRSGLRRAIIPLERREPRGASLPPSCITLRLTSACNLRCKMCRFVAGGEVSAPSGRLPWETWAAVVDDVVSARPLFTLTGGEPLLYPDVYKVIEYIRRKDLACILVTNGMLLAKSADTILHKPPSLIVVSIDGPSHAHDEIRGYSGSYKQAIAGIKAVLDMRVRQRFSRPLVVINSAITRHNFRSVGEMSGIAAELGVDALSYQFEWFLTSEMITKHNQLFGDEYPLSQEQMGSQDPFPVDIDELVSIVRRLRGQVDSSRGIPITFHPRLDDAELRLWYQNPLAWIRNRSATCAWFEVHIGHDGVVQPCLGINCGNVIEAKLTTIWNSARYRRYRRRLAEAGQFPMCNRCCAYFKRTWRPQVRSFLLRSLRPENGESAGRTKILETRS